MSFDGLQHELKDVKEQDFLRNQYLKELGIEVIRFSNMDIWKNFDAVCLEILEKINRLAAINL